MTLSDTQLLILSAASQRNDHAAILPANLKGSAAKKVIDRLLKQKLLQELRAKDDMPVWRRGHDNRPYTLRITKGGLKAIEVEDVADAPHENATPSPDEVVAANAPAETNLKERPGRARRSSAKKAAAPSAKATKASSGRPNPDSKQDRVIALLQQPRGATLDVLVNATGWQKHSVRGFLAGTVRKKLKLPLISEKVDGIRTYRIGASRAVKAASKRRST
ncbi:MAG TPA: DUF3489 domain-containing protein [Terriglobia bacterium]|nr:DUF3489 domain-containing protein [Terriglobia bacterium]